MTAAVLAIGTELTRGELVNTNAAWLSEELTKLGFEVTEHAVVDDDLERIIDVVQRVARRHQVVVASGGLGPTSDDLTTEAVAEAAGLELVRDERIVESIRQKFSAAGRVMPESNAKQADFPRGAQVLPNPIGTAPGFSVQIGSAHLFFMPGVPREMKHLFAEVIKPAVADLAEPRTHQIHVRTFGMTESGVAGALAKLEEEYPGLTLGYRAHFPEIEVKVRMRGQTLAEAQQGADRAAAKVRELLGDVVFGGRDDSYAAVVGKTLREAGLTLAIAESCTGGRIGEMLTSAPDASQFLILDAVVYANSAKEQVLGVSSDILEEHGAVSEQTAIAMAEGALRVAGADIAVSTTGIAGPTGGTPDKPVGTVWFGLAQRDRPAIARHRKLPWDRNRIQILSAYISLELVRRAALGRELDLAWR